MRAFRSFSYVVREDMAAFLKLILGRALAMDEMQ
jgi:hypothetical protein